MSRPLVPIGTESTRPRRWANVASVLVAVVVAAIVVSAAQARDGDRTIQVYKTPTCGCCVKWIDHLREAGFVVEATNLSDLSALKLEKGVPRRLASCHTAMIEGYVIEGHVPATDIVRLLRERPKVVGLAVPGMPLGSPGMEHPDPSRHEPYEVLAFGSDGIRRFSAHTP
ncbi:MAG: DUF411 domain-containing protein [Deltaproteobacteria bacterium]|nr:DUF411 domain-containing protein [Deltaproteobacteria bacterium]